MINPRPLGQTLRDAFPLGVGELVPVLAEQVVGITEEVIRFQEAIQAFSTELRRIIQEFAGGKAHGEEGECDPTVVAEIFMDRADSLQYVQTLLRAILCTELIRHLEKGVG
jgi:hypothetical protein